MQSAAPAAAAQCSGVARCWWSQAEPAAPAASSADVHVAEPTQQLRCSAVLVEEIDGLKPLPLF